MSDYPTADQIMAEARKIPPLAKKKMIEESESWEEEMHERHPNTKKYDPRLLHGWRYSVEASHIYDWIPAAFEPFTKPDLDQLETLTESMRKSWQALHSGGTGMLDTAKEQLGDGGWDGALATNFVNNFLTPMTGERSIPANQLSLAEALVKNMENIHELYGAARSDAYKLAKQTITALEACGDCKGSDIGLALAITGAVISVAGVALTPVTGGMSLVAGAVINTGIEVVKGGFAVGDKFTPEDGDIPLGADTTGGVVKNMSEALVKLSSGLERVEDRFIECLNRAYQNVTLVRGEAKKSGMSSIFMPLKPKLIDSGTDLTGLD
ncbi:hypothetical protein Afil01_29330 [Actinorhabdospora filicis]|uniref:Uncharacterized protein n=1 Tax=Actinorhabdospora filicis TaxID=1785913 RepID=A0A9W6WA13_9ACTN|nr:hypothetical protein [Actinorhabdospora filicis]GLZ78126.1 hypothetical protein Afil01_29330 [Actinorhabdospora filicis]